MNSRFHMAISLLFLLLTPPVFSKDVNKEDIATLKSEIEKMFADFEKGDAQALIDKTHPSIHKLAGGKEKFETMTKNVVAQMSQMDVKFLESELGEPTQLYPAGDEEVCFVPRTSVLEVQGTKVQSIGFMIAIRKTREKGWKYLDGSGLRKNPNLLSTLLPDLPKDIKYPPNEVNPL